MFSELPVRAQQWRDFASAHSRGLRLHRVRQGRKSGTFATAHSRGLRLNGDFMLLSVIWPFATAHSRGLRHTPSLKTEPTIPLPQRIRAGCDDGVSNTDKILILCHSAFVRVAT